MSVLVVWGEAPEYKYEEEFGSIKDALDWVNNAFDGMVVWNSTSSGHWFKIYKEVEIAQRSTFTVK